MDRAAPDPKQDTEPFAYPSGMEIRVLGSVEVRKDGETVPVGGPKQRSILALLVTHAGEPVSLDRIVDGVYGEEAADGARHSVQTYISVIRRDLGDIVRKDAGGYTLTVDADAIDAFRFEDEVRSALSLLEDDPETAAASLREALAMWRGHASADVDGWGVFEPEITRLSELRLSALEARIEADLALGRHRELLGELDSLTVEHPLRERFRAQQMLALYRSGRQTEALRAFERTRAYLGDEIGIDPSPELRNLEQQILDHDPALELPAAPSLTERAVMVVEVADLRTLMRLDPDERASLVESIAAAFSAALERTGGEGFAQRGSALYAAFPAVGDAIATVSEVVAAAGPGRARVAIDYGDVEVHESGEVAGPPVRRSAGIVAAAHGGQVLLSDGAHQALLGDGESGWLVRSLGLHPIHGVDVPQQVFQLVLDGQDREFPPLLLDATPPPLPSDRGAVAGYELRRPISSDLAGTTYRAYQPSVGREVVVTVIDPVWANEPEFISRFEVETQLVTRLQHPHVVPVLDYWRDPTGAYLVAPSIGGTSLAQALYNEDFSDDQRRRLVTQVGTALSYAHQLGVVHGAVSPDSVTLDDSGNAYLTGAGFVVRLAGAPRASSAYSAPEYARDDPITPAADIYGLGLLGGELIGDLVTEIVERATAARPEDRFDTIDELLAELAVVLGEAETAVAFTASRNPYKGLQAFDEADAGDFFGRSDAVGELTEQLAAHRLVAVVGPSGSGKSSLVKAGLIPAVRAGAVDPSQHWVITDMFPGSYPFVELESALARVAVEDPGGVMDELDRDSQGLVRVIKRILPASARLLLVIDQFEELFTLTRDDTTRDRFLEALVALASDERSDVRVLVTLRADFFDRPLQYPEFGGLLTTGMFALTTPAPEQLVEAIRLPAEGVGVSWETGLVNQIVDDVAESPGTLPLLQYALTEVFAARQSDELTYDRYVEAGGVLGVLGTQANEVFDGLDEQHQSIARQLFLRLVAVQPSGEQTRRRARLLDLNAIADPGEVETVLGAFGDARLLTFDRDPVTRGPTVEVAHEAMLTRWPRLADWINEAKEDLLLHQRLADTVSEWEQQDRGDAYLLTGGRLAQFQVWAQASELSLAGVEAEYLELSSAREGKDRSRRRRIRNLVTAGFAAAAVVATALGLLANANAGLAHSRELAASAINVAVHDPELSLLLSLEAANDSDPTVESASALHDSLATYRKAFTYTWPAEEELSQNLSTRLSPDGRLLVASAGGTYIEVVDIDSGEQLWSHEFGGEGITRAIFTHDGSGVVATYGWSSGVGESSPDAATASALGVHLLDARTGEAIEHFEAGPCGVVTLPEALAVAGDSSVSYLITPINESFINCDYRGVRGEEGRYRTPPLGLFDLTTGEIERLPNVPSVNIDSETGAFSEDFYVSAPVLLTADARFLVMADFDSEGVASLVIDRRDGLELARLHGGPMALSVDGTRLMTEGPEGPMIWDLSAGQPSEPLVVFPRSEGIFLSPDGGVVGIPEEGAVISLRDAATGEEVDRLLTGFGSVYLPSYGAEGSLLLVSEVFGDNAVVFDLAAPVEIASVTLCPGRFFARETPVDVAGDAAVVNAHCIPSGLGTHFVLGSDSYHPKASVENVAGERGALSQDGRLLATQSGRPDSFAGPIEIHDTSTGEVVVTLEGLCEHDAEEWGRGPDCVEFPSTPFPDWANDLVFSSDGSLLAMAGANWEKDAVVVWDTETGNIVATPMVEHKTPDPKSVFSVAFSPDGDRLAASFEPAPKELWILSTETWDPTAVYNAPANATSAEAPSDWLVFTPDGELLIGTDPAGFGEGRIVFMDGVTLEYLDEIPEAHAGGISQLAINEDGTLLATSGLDGFVRVWDVETRSLVHQIRVSSDGPVAGVAFNGQHLLVTIPATGELRGFTIDNDELLDLARSRLSRSFSAAECITYRIDPCPTLEETKAG